MEVNCTIYSSGCIGSEIEMIGILGVMTPVLSIGIVFNTLLLIILMSPEFSAELAVFTFLRAIAFMDLCVCILVIPIGFCRCLYTENYTELMIQACYDAYVYYPFANICGTNSLFLTVVLCVDIYVGTRFPGISKHWRTTKTARFVILVTCAVSVIANIPLFFIKTVIIDPDPRVGPTTFGASQGAVDYLWFRLAFMKLLPLLALLILATLLLIALYEAYYNPRNKGQKNEEWKVSVHSSVTWMVLAVAIFCLITHFPEPFAHGDIFAAIFGECSVFEKPYRIFVLVVMNLESLSNSVKLVIYCAFLSIFIETFKKIFCKCRDRPKVEPENETSDDISAST